MAFKSSTPKISIRVSKKNGLIARIRSIFKKRELSMVEMDELAVKYSEEAKKAKLYRQKTQANAFLSLMNINR